MRNKIMELSAFVVTAGGYSLGVNNFGEAVLAATGDRAYIEGIGYPGMVSDFFGAHSDESVWDSTQFEVTEATLETLEIISGLEYSVYELGPNKEYRDITYVFKSAINELAKEFKWN